MTPVPDIRVSATLIDFGEVEVDQSSQLPLIIYNDGDATLLIDDIIPSDPQFTVPNLSNITIDPSSQITVDITFTPASVGDQTATLNIISNDPDELLVQVDLEGKGIVTPVPDIRVWPPSIDFGNVVVGASQLKTLWIYNDGGGTLQISSITSNRSQFVALTTPDVAPDSVAAVSIRFTPTFLGIRTGTLTIASNDPDESSITVSVSGKGVSSTVPDISVSPSSLAFGEVNVGSSRDRTFEIHNDGGATLYISSITSNNDQFEVLNDSNVPQGDMLEVTVRFTPVSVGIETGTITIASNDPDEPNVLVQVAGEGIHAPDIYVAPPGISFGELELGESSDGSFFIYNFGDLLLQIVSITSSSDQFQVLSQPSDLTPDSFVEIWVRFAPSSPGNKTGSISINSNDSDEPVATISLSGSGVYPEFPIVGNWQIIRQQNLLTDLYDVNFVNNDDGWVVGYSGTVAYSSNGGSTWTPQSSNTNRALKGVYFTTSDKGWAVGEDGTILRTTNGGQSWSTWNSDVSVDLNAIQFTNNNRGWIVGQAGTILTTSNNYTWNPRSSGTQFSLNDVYFASSYRGWAVGSYGTILRSTNGGLTWTPQDSGTTATLYGVKFVDYYAGWAVGSSGVILHTHDGGDTWTRQTNGVPYVLLRDVDFINSSEGWAVGDGSGVILYTGDGGSTWSRLSDVVNDNLRAVQFRDADNGWVAGSYGTILKYYSEQPPPEIISVDVTGSPASTGDVITVVATGQPGNQGKFSISGVITNVPMTENPPGTYTGSYTVVEGVNKQNARVTVALRNQYGEVATDTSQSVTIDTVAIIHSASVNPTTVKAGDIVTVAMAGEAGGTARFTIESIATNRIMTEDPVTPGSYTGQYTVSQGMNAANVEVTVRLTDQLGNVDTRSAGQLTIDTSAYITTVSVTGSPAKYGDPIVVVLVGEIGGSAEFSISGLVSDVAMPEDQQGIYTGRYTAPEGTHVENAAVNAQLTDALGNTATKYAGRVTIDTESRIDSVNVSGSPAKAGETIGVALVGEQNGTARFSIAGIIGDIPMTETQTGVYTGTYTVPDGINATNALLTVTLIDSVGNVGTDTSQSVTIDSTPPEIASVNVSGSPAKSGETITITVVGEPNASAEFSIAGVIEDVPMTQDQPGVYTGIYIVPDGINVTDAVVTVTLTDAVGNVNTDASQSVSIDTVLPGMISVSVSGSPAKAGETIVITATGEPGSSAKLSIASVIDDVPMIEDQPGVYTGAYVVPDGINATNAVVSVTLTDPVGNVSVDTSQSVTIDTEAPEIAAVTVSGSPAEAGETINIIVVGESGMSIQSSIAGAIDNIPMTEAQPGVYAGAYVVPDGINVTDAVVTVILTDTVGNVSVDTSQRVTIDTEAPEITSVSVAGSPAKAEEIISITVVGESGMSIQTSIAGVMDNIPMTETQPGVYTGAYVVPDGINATDAVVTVILTDTVGNVSVDTSQRVTIDTTSPEIASVSVLGDPAKVGETIGVTMVGESGGKAQFSIAGVAENIPMEEDTEKPGTYTGTFTVTDDGINTTDAVLTVTLEDAAGNVGSDASEKVSIRPPWDVNSDGSIDIADLEIIGTQFGRAVPEGSDADVNGDGYVDTMDLIIIAKNFDGTTNAASPGKWAAAVDPEQLSVLRELYEKIEGNDDDVMMVRKLLAELIGLPAIQITRSRLMQNYPNPCNPETWIPYELAEAGNVTIRIYTPTGQLVRTLELGHRPSGSYSDRSNAAYWDGMNESGEKVSSGIYFYAIRSGSFSAVGKMIVSM